MTRAEIARIGQVVFLAGAAFFVYAFAATAKDGEHRRACSSLCALRPNYAAVRRRAPDFELPNLSGKTVKLSSFRGKTVILNFWSKSCPPCLEEMPSLAQLAHQLRDRSDVVLITISTDESAADARATLDSVLGTAAPFEVLVDPDGEVIRERFGTRLYPETWFIDPDGVVRARVDGARDWSTALPGALADSLGGPLVCPVEFHQGQPSGEAAYLCTGG